MRYILQTALFCVFATALLATRTTSTCVAQSTFDMEPPLQAKADTTLTMSPDPKALPVFKFATAELTEEGKIKIATKVPVQTLVAPMPGSIDPELDPQGIHFTENVTQNYTVMVPYTETLDDGTQVQRTRAETRTRTVAVQRMRKRTAEEQKEFEELVAKKEKEDAANGSKPKIEPARQTNVTQEYQIQIPYTETINGKNVTKMRTETRTRTVVAYRGKTNTTSRVIEQEYDSKSVKCFSVNGTELSQAEIQKRLADRQPVVLINSEQAISPYFETILHPNAMFVVSPENE
jgi:hypothetical protein